MHPIHTVGFPIMELFYQLAAATRGWPATVNVTQLDAKHLQLQPQH